MTGQNDELSIVQFSDTHIVKGLNFNKDAFLKATEMINRSKADYFIHTGDVTEEGTREDYELAEKFLSNVKKKVFYIIGNHDARNVGYELFEEHIGPRNVLYVDDRVLIAGFDSTIPDRDEGRLGARSLHELKKVLKEEGDGRTKIVAFHHHLLPVPRAGRERSMIVDAGDVLEAIVDYGVDLVLNGHRHSPNLFRIEDTMVVNSGTVSHYKTRAGDCHSFNLIKISPKGVFEVKVCGIERPLQRGFVKSVERKDRLVKASGRRMARIAHISDTHFAHSLEFLSEAFEMAAKRIKQANPDLVVHCGNLTHDGLPDSFEIAARELRKIPDPKIILPGPNDLLHLGHLLFRERIGEFTPTFRRRMFTVYGANSSQYDDMTGRIGRSSLHILVQRISKVGKGSAKIVAFHHHILPLPHTTEKYPIEDAGDVLNQLLDAKVDIILTGHRHIGYAQKVGETVVVNANTLSSRRFQARYGNTFNLIDILSDGAAIVSEIGVATGMRRILGIYKLPSLST